MSERGGLSRDFVVKGIIVFVIVVAGTFTGIFVAVKSGITESIMFTNDKPSKMMNNTNIKEGDRLPSLTVTDVGGELFDVSAYLSGHKTIVGFVSSGCQPCKKFVEFMTVVDSTTGGSYQVLLLARDPAYFEETSNFRAMEATQEIFDDLNVHIFPTIVGVKKTGEIGFVSEGFRRTIDNDFLLEKLQP